MTTRVYLAAARFLDEPPQHQDQPVERVFVNSSDVPEIWVETESTVLPDVGRVATFALSRPLELGFTRVIGTVERLQAK